MSIASSQAPTTSYTSPVKQHDSAPKQQLILKPFQQQPSTSTEDFAVGLPPNSDAWQSGVAPQSSPAADADDFGLNLPPPDSNAWETLAVPTSARRPPKDWKTKLRTRRTGF